MAEALNVNKRNNVSRLCFTLPISCQICLDKVKDPVVCSNRHVFCSVCVEIWTQRSSVCPTCRTDISAANPCLPLLGGPRTQDCGVEGELEGGGEGAGGGRREMRRVRLELLCAEYEADLNLLEQTVKQKQEEIDELRQQLCQSGSSCSQSDKSSSNCNQSEQSSSESHASSSSAVTAASNSKRKMNECEECKELKAELKREKKETARYKEESLSLKRDLERVKIDLMSRSPRRFGRYTVGALESKLQASERHVSQLSKALEKSDEYIAQLEDQLRALRPSGVPEGSRDHSVPVSLESNLIDFVPVDVANISSDSSPNNNPVVASNRLVPSSSTIPTTASTVSLDSNYYKVPNVSGTFVDPSIIFVAGSTVVPRSTKIPTNAPVPISTTVVPNTTINVPDDPNSIMVPSTSLVPNPLAAPYVSTSSFDPNFVPTVQKHVPAVYRHTTAGHSTPDSLALDERGQNDHLMEGGVPSLQAAQSGIDNNTAIRGETANVANNSPCIKRLKFS